MGPAAGRFAGVFAVVQPRDVAVACGTACCARVRGRRAGAPLRGRCERLSDAVDKKGRWREVVLNCQQP